MHPYSTNSLDRALVPAYLAVAGIVSAYVLGMLSKVTDIAIPWWIDAPSVVGFASIYYHLFRTCLWKWRYARKLTFARIPDLSGKWEGDIRSSFDDFRNEVKATLIIFQNWDSISCLFETAESRSRSSTASISVDDSGVIALSYVYENDPRPDAKETMHFHKGCAILFLECEGTALTGEYFTGRDRKNHGAIVLKRAR